MTFTPCKIEEIPAITAHKSSSVKASLIAFLAMETPSVKVEGVSGSAANSRQSVLTQIAKKEGFPIKALTRKGTLYLVNTAKAPEFAV